MQTDDSARGVLLCRRVPFRVSSLILRRRLLHSEKRRASQSHAIARVLSALPIRTFAFEQKRRVCRTNFDRQILTDKHFSYRREYSYRFGAMHACPSENPYFVNFQKNIIATPRENRAVIIAITTVSPVITNISFVPSSRRSAPSVAKQGM